MCLCVLFSSLSSMLSSTHMFTTLSLNVPHHLLQRLNLHTRFSSFYLLPHWSSPASPTWYASFIYFFVHLCPFCQFSYSFHSSIHLLIICPERQSVTQQHQKKSGLTLFCNVPYCIQVGHRRRKEEVKRRQGREEYRSCDIGLLNTDKSGSRLQNVTKN